MLLCFELLNIFFLLTRHSVVSIHICMVWKSISKTCCGWAMTLKDCKTSFVSFKVTLSPQRIAKLYKSFCTYNCITIHFLQKLLEELQNRVYCISKTTVNAEKQSVVWYSRIPHTYTCIHTHWGISHPVAVRATVLGIMYVKMVSKSHTVMFVFKTETWYTKPTKTLSEHVEWKLNHPVKEVSFCIRRAKHYYTYFFTFSNGCSSNI